MAKYVGRPGPYEQVCAACDGNGQLNIRVPQSCASPSGYLACEACAATGVVPVLVPCISLWQPWASLCFAPCPTGDDSAAKRHETRAYPPPSKYVGQRIGIHAAKRAITDLSPVLVLLSEAAFGSVAQLPRGAIIGTVMLVGFGRTEDVQPVTFANTYAGDWTPGRWAWELADPKPLHQPPPWKGKQGWFMVEARHFAAPPPLGPVPVDTGNLRRSLVGTFVDRPEATDAFTSG